MEAKNYKFGMFCQQCYPSVAPGDADIRPRNASGLPDSHPPFCWRRNFVYISILENRGGKSVDHNFWNIAFNSHANFREKALTAQPQKPKLA